MSRIQMEIFETASERSDSATITQRSGARSWTTADSCIGPTVSFPDPSMELVGLESRRVEPSRAVFLLQGTKPVMTVGNIRYTDCAIIVPVSSEKEACRSYKHVESV